MPAGWLAPETSKFDGPVEPEPDNAGGGTGCLQPLRWHPATHRPASAFMPLTSPRTLTLAHSLHTGPLLVFGLAVHGALAEVPLEEITVYATLRPDHARQRSITTFDANNMQQRSAQHLEDLLSLAPNVNSASGASRGRFLQIRGIGERSQFVEPVNASVALSLIHI